MADTHVRKITASDAFLRPVTTETPIMRIQGIAREGWEELTTLGRFVRWGGMFGAQCVTEDGEVLTETSYALILPGVASDWLASYFRREDVDLAKNPDERRTGAHFMPQEELVGGCRFVIDLSLVPPSSTKPSQTGYEYKLSVRAADPRYDPMAELQAGMMDAPAFLPGKVAALPKLAAPKAVPAPEPARVGKGASGRKRAA